MSISLEVGKPAGSAEASGALAKGVFVKRANTGTQVGAAAAQNWAIGVTANSAAAQGDTVLLYLPGQYAKVQCSSVIAAGASTGGIPLGVDADGKARSAVAGDRVMALYQPGKGEACAAGDIISVLLLSGETVHS